jgi:hypothetical protein
MATTPVASIFQSLNRREKELKYETRSKTLHHYRGQP